MPWTTDDLVTAVRRSGWLPTASDIAATDILAWGDAELRGEIGGVLKRAREEHRVLVSDIAITSGVTRYRVPRRAIGRTVRAITVLDSAGTEGPADEITPSDAWRYSGSRSARVAYYFEADEIVLTSTPTTSTDSLRVRYLARPPRLIETTSASPIDKPLTTTTIRLDVTVTPPVTLTTAASYVDVVRGDSPFDTSYSDLLAASFATPILTLNSSTPIVVADMSDYGANLGARRDYLCPRDCTVYPPIPEELHDALAMAICVRALKAQGDSAGAAAARDEMRSSAKAAKSILEPRNQDRRPRIVDRGGRMRSGASRWGR